MKFTITREQLQAGLTAVVAAVPAKTTRPVLANVPLAETKESPRLAKMDVPAKGGSNATSRRHRPSIDASIENLAALHHPEGVKRRHRFRRRSYSRSSRDGPLSRFGARPAKHLPRGDRTGHPS